MNNFPRIECNLHQVNPLLACPRTIAMLFAGSALYVGLIDPSVRNSLQGTRNRLKHWSTMFRISKKFMGSLSIVGFVAGLVCYYQTKQVLWLAGSGVMLSAWPYTLLFMSATNKYLVELDAQLDPRTDMTSGQKYTALQKMQKWVNLHRVRIGISLIAAGLFYLAEYNSQKSLIQVK